MNGDHSTVVEFAQRAHEAAERSATHALRADQAMGRMERELAEIRREMRHGFEALSAAIAPARTKHHSILEEEDWEDSPTGTHKMVSKRKFESWARERELTADGQRWRKALNTSGKIALALTLVVLGWIVRHYLGKP